jgi:hypothetical protein
MINLRKCIIAATVAFGSLASASAQVVVQTYDFQVPPTSQGAVASAMAKFASSDVFKTNMKGAVYLNSYDFGSSATHSIAVFEESPSAASTTSKAFEGSAEAAELAATFSKNANFLGASYHKVLKSWNPADGSPNQFQTYAFQVSNPAGVVKALDMWLNSDPGKSLNSSVTLTELRSGTVPGQTHALIVIYEDRGIYEEAWTKATSTKEWSKFVTAFQRHATTLGSVMGTSLAGFGDMAAVGEMLD